MSPPKPSCRATVLRIGLLAVILSLPALASSALSASARASSPGQDDELATAAKPVPTIELSAAAAALSVKHGRKSVRARDLAETLSAAVLGALNDWAPLVTELDWEIRVSETADHMALGPVKDRQLQFAVQTMDVTRTLVDEWVPVLDDRPLRAVVAILFDERDYHSKHWESLLRDMAERSMILPADVDRRLADPGSLRVRRELVFVQSIEDPFDDGRRNDTFRLENEVTNLYVQCLLTGRVGAMPSQVLWGLGYVAEYRQFEAVHCFDVFGFVPVADHVDWPERAATLLLDAGEDALSTATAAHGQAGRAVPSQRLTWAALDYLASTHPDRLHALLADLSALQPPMPKIFAGVRRFEGLPAATEAVLREHLDSINTKDLTQHLRGWSSQR